MHSRSPAGAIWATALMLIACGHGATTSSSGTSSPTRGHPNEAVA